MDGILLIDKPSGWTSFDVVNKVRHIVQASDLNTSAKKRFPVGHTGTLDPLATGLLVLVLGTYTKHVPELSRADKSYQVTLKLGETSATGDEEGQKTHVSAKKPTKSEVLAATGHFVGEIDQIPPAYSAIKVGGQRAYKLARAGKEVKLEPRKVTIYDITGVEYAYPTMSFTAHVSSGTYIRTLVEDIGKHLGTGAYMTNLRRTRVGSYKIEDSSEIVGLNAETIRGRLLQN